MIFEGLSDKLQGAFSKLKSKGKLTEVDVKNAMREVKLALLEADVNFKVVKDFIKKVQERCVGQEVMQSLTPAQHVIKIVNEELTSLMGDVHDFYKALYMKDKVGQEFEGVVSSVTSFGIFVELDNTIEGLIRLANMNDDYYIYDESSYSVLGERTKKSYKIGDLVKIKVESVNVDFKEIDFEIVEKIEE